MPHIVVTNKIFKFLDNIEQEYRYHHPELNEIRISKNKLIYEMMKYYLKDSKFRGDFI